MIVVVGLSHRTAPIEVREQLALPSDVLPDVLKSLVASRPIGEALVVSTCNRVEIVVAGADGPRANMAELGRATLEAVAARAPKVKDHLYLHEGRDAVRHLFRVAASLDSLVVGEPQILGQVKDAYDMAREVGTTGGVLNRVIPRAIKSAKRVRSETTIGVGQVSVPSVAVDLARQIFGDLSRHTVALVGSGDMGETVARLLRQAGARLLVVGRNAERVREIAALMEGEPRSMDQLESALVEADVVVTTTSSPTFIVDAGLVRKLRRPRRGRSLFFIDLAVPRDVDPRVGELDSVFLYNVDDLSSVVAKSMEERRREAERAEAIVSEEAESYERWADAEQVTPTIVALREKFRRVLETEVERSTGGKLRHLGQSERDALHVMVEAALNKMLHPPTTRLRKMAVDPSAKGDLELFIGMLNELFALNTESGEPPPRLDPATMALVTQETEAGRSSPPGEGEASPGDENVLRAREAS